MMQTLINFFQYYKEISIHYFFYYFKIRSTNHLQLISIYLFPDGYQRARKRVMKDCDCPTALACVNICATLLVNPFLFVLLFFPIPPYL